MVDEHRCDKTSDLGEPVSVHSPAGWLRYVDRLSEVDRVVPCVLAVAFPALAVYFVWLHLSGRIPAEFPPFVMLAVAAIAFAIGIGSAVLAWRAIRKPPKVIVRPGYTVYKDALVIKVGDAINVLRWSDVRELLSPAATGGKFRLISED